MLRTLYRYIPRFVTQYYVVVKVSDGPKGMAMGFRVPSEKHLDPTRPAIRIRFFNLFGWPVGLVHESRPPLTP